jgi:hypothetical protein
MARIVIHNPGWGKRKTRRIETSRDRLKKLRAENARRFRNGVYKHHCNRKRWSRFSGGSPLPSSAVVSPLAFFTTPVAKALQSMDAHAKDILARPSMLSKRQLRAAKEK